MPANAIYVGRPTKFGNPFWHVLKFHGVERAVELYANMVRGLWVPPADWPDSYVRGVYEDHEEWGKRLRRLSGVRSQHPLEIVRQELRGRDLACWCPLPKDGEPDICHAAVLLELANTEPVPLAPGATK